MGLSKCVSLAKTHWLICNITYLVHYATSRDLDLGSDFDLDLSRSIFLTRVDEKNAMAFEFTVIFLVSKVPNSLKTFFLQKMHLYTAVS